MAQCFPAMSTASNAEKDMQAFWDKNKALNRPESPWAVYKFEHQMVMSLAHRISGAAVGVVFYAGGIALAVAPDTIPVYMEALKSLELGPAVMFPVKFIIAFPVMYHTMTGIRHMVWDFHSGYKIPQVKQMALVVMGVSIGLSALLAGIAYI